MGEIIYKKTTCIYTQQCDSESNVWECSECKEEIYWGERGDDLDIKFCPYCGKRIEESIKIKDDIEEE